MNVTVTELLLKKRLLKKRVAASTDGQGMSDKSKINS